LKIDIRNNWALYQSAPSYEAVDNNFEITLHAHNYPITVKSNLQNFYGYPLIPLTKVLYPNCTEEYNYSSSIYYTDKFYDLLTNNIDSVVITDTAITSFIINFDIFVGINEFNQTSPSWKIQPNPANDKITIGNLQNFNGRLEILNILGEIVFAHKIYAVENATISINQLKNGVYFIRYYDNETKTYSTNKLIKN